MQIWAKQTLNLKLRFSGSKHIFIAAPIMMLSQKDDFKPEQIAVNGAIVGALGVLALKAAKN